MAGPVTVQELASAPTPRPSIAGELGDILIELSSALQKFCMYSSGHPVLPAAAEAVSRRFARRRGHRGTLCVAVASDHLIVEIRPKFELARHFEGTTSRLTHPLLQTFAHRLREHELAEIAMAEGVTAREMVDLLTILATDPGETGRPLGAEADDVLRDLPHVRIRREGAGATRSVEDDGDADGSEQRHTQLWEEFARDALGFEEGEGPRSYHPEAVARAIDIRSGSEAFDRRMVAHLIEIADDLGDVGTLEAIELRKQISAVLRNLDKVTLQCLMNMTGNGQLRQQLMSHFAHALDVDVVLELLNAAAEDQESDISRWMIRLLSKLSRSASQDEAAVVAYRSDDGLRRVVQRLISGWQLENPNPEDYEEVLADMSMRALDNEHSVSRESAVEPTRVVQLSLETDVAADSLDLAVDHILRTGQTAGLMDLLDELPPDGCIAASIWSRLADSAVLRQLIEEENPDFSVIDRILPHAGQEATGPLLDRLASADSMTVRRQVFDRLKEAGSDVAPMTLQRIGGTEETPWFVLRNMLSLLVVLEELPSDFDPRGYADHENDQVRQEALRLSVRIPEMRDEAILKALEDVSPRTVALGVYEAEMGAPAGAEAPLTRIAVSASADADLRTHAVRALARMKTAGGLETLLALVRPRRHGLRKTLHDTSPVGLAAIRQLAEHWPAEPRAAAILKLARASSDRAVAKAAS